MKYPLKQVRKWIMILIAAGAVLIIGNMILLEECPEAGKAATVVLLLLYAVLWLVNVKYWRCPSCDKELPLRGMTELTHTIVTHQRPDGDFFRTPGLFLRLLLAKSSMQVYNRNVIM